MPSSPESRPEPTGPDSSIPGPDGDEGVPYRELFEAHPHPMFVFDVETRAFLMVNEAAILQYGYSREEFSRMTLRDIRPPEEVAGMEQIVEEGGEGLRKVEGTWHHRARDGRVFPVAVTSQPFVYRDGAARLVQAQDISDRVVIQKEQERLLERERQARSSAQQTEARFRQAFDGAAMGIVLADAHGEIRYANPTILRILGYTLDEFLEMNPRDLTHPDDRDGNLAGILEIREGLRDSFVVEKRYLRKDGTPIWVRSSVSALRNPQGEITDYLGVIQDLSSEMEALERLDFSRRLVAMAGRLAKLGGWTVDFRANTVYWSDEVAAIHEEPPGTVVSVDEGIDYYAPEWRPVLREHFTACAQEGTPYDLELEIITRTGRRVWVRTTGEAVRSPDGEIVAVQGAFRDISRERAIRAALEAGEERFRAVARATVDAAFDYDLEADTIWWSEGVESVFGYTPSEMGSDRAAWEARIHPDDRARVNRAARRAEGEDEDISEFEYRFRRKDGTYVLVSDRAWVLRDDKGRPIRKVGGIRDITEQRRMERHYLRAQRMESLGTLASGIAHDLNNVLTPILMTLGLLETQVVGAEGQELLDTVRTSAERGADLVKQVLGFARGVEGARSAVDPGQMVTEVSKIIRETFPKKVELTVSLDPDLPSVIGDATQIQQILLNLCLNARDALPEGGHLEIRAQPLSIDSSTAGTLPDARSGDYVEIAVRDDGTGMSKEIQERAFEPFFTTKEVGEGTGLGLSTAAAIVRSHDGFLTLESSEGVGTTVRVHLPVGEAPAGPAAKKAVWSTGLRGAGEVILVVDDESAIRKVTRRILELHGYRVVTASHGAEALSLYQLRGQEIDLVLTDMTMPVMDGMALVRTLRRAGSTVPIVAVSGREGTAAQFGDRDAVRFLPKPYTPDQLLTILRQALDTTSP